MQLPPTKSQVAKKVSQHSVKSSASSSSNSTRSGSAQASTSNLSNTPAAPASSKGQIHVKLIAARGLNVRSISARPYVVVVFEQNEFVSRDPTDETDKEVKGVPTNLSRVSSSIALSTLGAIGSKVLGNGASTASSSSTNSAKSSLSAQRPAQTPALGGLGGRMSAHNPVWKHEVSL